MALLETPQARPLQKVSTIPSRQQKAAEVQAPLVQAQPAWEGYEKNLFRFFFIFFTILALPLDGQYYRHLFSIHWLDLQFRDIFYLARFAPTFVSDVPTFADWGIVAVIAAVGAAVWAYVDRARTNYDALYYALRVVLRYRLALALLAYGFLKLFPLQMPEPSLSNLNTNYGDFTAWKIFSLSTGIVPGYESFLGGVEIFAALLLLFRKTASIGAFIIIPFTGNVFISNLAYEGGEYVYSFYLVSIALFLFAFDARRLVQLTGLERPTEANQFKPAFAGAWQRYGRLALKTGFVLLFVLVYGTKTYAAYKQGPYQFPTTPGLPNAQGVYTVSEFRVNGETLAPSATDARRWKDVVFEKWATLSVRVNRPIDVDLSSTEEIYTNDEDRTYEQAGSAGRAYYHYEQTAGSNLLTLRNINKQHRDEVLSLKVDRPSETRIVLSGIDEHRDSIYVVLDKINKKYLLEEAARQGRRRGLKL